jgi:hypothetical protein
MEIANRKLTIELRFLPLQAGRRYPVRGKAFLPLKKLKFILSYHFNTSNQNYYSLAKQTGSDWLRYTNALSDKHLIV